MSRKQRLIQRAMRTGEPVEQVAALPWRRRPAGGAQVLLVTSRRRGRLVLPKGWPMRRRTRPESAAIEALQEAGVSGRIGWYPVGWFLTEKLLSCGSVPVLVVVYPLEVTNILRDWRESAQRRRLWVPARDAAARVEQPELARLLHGLCSAGARRPGGGGAPTDAAEAALIPAGTLPLPGWYGNPRSEPARIGCGPAADDGGRSLSSGDDDDVP